MKTQRQFQTVQPAQNRGRRDLPAWAIEAGFQRYTMYSNGTLEAHMAPGRPYRERILAYSIRNAWGRQCEFVLAKDGSAAWQTDYAKDLNIPKQHVSAAFGELEEMGWLRCDGKMIYPVAFPPKEEAAPELEETGDEELGLPDFDSWIAAESANPLSEFAALSTDFETVLKQWNEVRKRRRAALSRYQELAEHLRAQKVTGTADGAADEKSPVQNVPAAVPGTNGSGYHERILIEGLEAKKELASYENQSAIEELRKKISTIQSQGILSRLGPFSKTTASRLLEHGTPDEVINFLQQTSRDHKADHWQGWGLAVFAVRDDLATWRAGRATATPEPAEEATPERILESNISVALCDAAKCWDDLPDYPQRLAAVAELEREHPALVARIREQLKSEGAL